MLLDGKTGVVFGVANKRSLAWAIARRASEEGARIALTYQGERLEENARELAQSLKDPLVLPCDVSRDEDIAAVFSTLKQEFGSLDFLVHGIAYALREELEGEYLSTSREGYRVAQDVSVYSLTAIARSAAPLMEERGGSILTLTYLGGERVIPGYNVMGVAKAALDMTDWRLSQRRVTSPIAARVADVLARPGETMAAGAPVVSLLPPGNIFVRFFVPEADLARMHRGDSVRLTCDGCRADINAVISFVSPQAEYTPPVIYSEESRAKLVYSIEARPPPDQAVLFNPGQPVTVLPFDQTRPAS